VIAGLILAAALAVTSPAPAAPGTCPLTLPNGSTPPGDQWAGMNHGNGKLWTVFWAHNVVIATQDVVEKNGSIGIKWPWWRGMEGELAILGHRLDGNASRLRADIPSGYGASGFLPSGIYFPTEGCWEVAGAVGTAKLTFVTLVVKASTYGLRADYR
jgi:hypothetical protein